MSTSKSKKIVKKNKPKQSSYHPVVLAILDGWGINKKYIGNAVELAKKPNFDWLWQNFSHTQLQASGRFVGLPAHQDGNSEAGHLNLGAGRIVEQDSVIINKAIKSGLFFKNPAFQSAIEHAKKNDSAIHLMGLLTGWQSAHADPEHLLALLQLLRNNKIKKVYLHLFTDGRDSFKYGALNFLKKIENKLKSHEKIASITGRYYAMDRIKDWSRTEIAYDALVLGQAKYYTESAKNAIQRAYDLGETDEFILPTVIVKDAKCDKRGVCIGGQPVGLINDNDAIIFFNLRSDRSRQLVKVFDQDNFNKNNPGSFIRKKVLKNIIFVSMTESGPNLKHVLAAFPAINVKKTLPFVLHEYSQLYAAETEKFAHITYFLNGGYPQAVAGEERATVPSADVATYDLRPAMSAKEINKIILKSLKNQKHQFIAVNFANPDMVAHTGNLAAGIKAIETVDSCLGDLIKIIKNKKGILMVTSDHGNAEEMIEEKTGEIDTQHSSNPVPFILADFNKNIKYQLKNDGVLGNVAPTILELMALKKPQEMSCKSLIIK